MHLLLQYVLNMLTYPVEELTPAQALLLSKPYTCKGESLMRLAFVHLIFHKVLAVSPRQGGEQEAAVWIEKGAHFSSYRPKPHELPFYLPFKMLKGSLSLSSLWRRVAINMKEGAQQHVLPVFKARVKSDLANERYLSSNPFKRLGNAYALTRKGEQTQNAIKEGLKVAQAQLERLKAIKERISSHSEVANLGSHLFLVEGWNAEYLKAFKMKANEVAKQEAAIPGSLLLLSDLSDTLDVLDISLGAVGYGLEALGAVEAAASLGSVSEGLSLLGFFEAFN